VPPLLHVKDLRTYYFGFRGTRVVKAVDGVSFSLEAGETFGLVGESGCGKTTTRHSLVRLLSPSARIVGGRIELEGEDLAGKSTREMREIRGRRIATILQEPMASLDPLFSIYEPVAEPAYYHQSLRGQKLVERVRDLLTAVRIPSPAARMKEFPHQMSGGMRQRLAIARALSTHARLIVLDEPVSALDVSIRAHIIGLLEKIQARMGVSYLFIAHDLAAVAHISHQIAVMYLGKIVEIADSPELCDKPLHPYTRALFAASLPSHPDEEREEIVLSGEVPSALNPPSGCRFHPRCPFAMPRCAEKEPELVEVAAGHQVACYLY
jgi:oligopeptide/dipeptide ABC transporter ATP-binding protein